MACETTAAAPPDARPDVAIVSDVEPFDAPDAASPLDAPGAMDALRLDAPPDATRDGSRQCPIGCAAGCGEGRRCPMSPRTFEAGVTLAVEGAAAERLWYVQHGS